MYVLFIYDDELNEDYYYCLFTFSFVISHYRKLFSKQFSESHPVPNPSKPTKPGSSVNDFSFR